MRSVPKSIDMPTNQHKDCFLPVRGMRYVTGIFISSSILPMAARQTLFNPKTSIPSQKRHPCTGKLNSETSGDSKNAFPHCADVSCSYYVTMRDAWQHYAGKVRKECVEGLRRVVGLRRVEWARQVDSLNLLPTCLMLNLLDKKFGGELTKEDVQVSSFSPETSILIQKRPFRIRNAHFNSETSSRHWESKLKNLSKASHWNSPGVPGTADRIWAARPTGQGFVVLGTEPLVLSHADRLLWRD